MTFIYGKFHLAMYCGKCNSILTCENFRYKKCKSSSNIYCKCGCKTARIRVNEDGIFIRLGRRYVDIKNIDVADMWFRKGCDRIYFKESDSRYNGCHLTIERDVIEHAP